MAPFGATGGGVTRWWCDQVVVWPGDQVVVWPGDQVDYSVRVRVLLHRRRPRHHHLLLLPLPPPDKYSAHFSPPSIRKPLLLWC